MVSCIPQLSPQVEAIYSVVIALSKSIWNATNLNSVFRRRFYYSDLITPGISLNHLFNNYMLLDYLYMCISNKKFYKSFEFIRTQNLCTQYFSVICNCLLSIGKCWQLMYLNFQRYTSDHYFFGCHLGLWTSFFFYK